MVDLIARYNLGPYFNLVTLKLEHYSWLVILLSFTYPIKCFKGLINARIRVAFGNSERRVPGGGLGLNCLTNFYGIDNNL